VISYYSMLTTSRGDNTNVQVCTNYCLPAARRRRSSRTLREKAWHPPQGHDARRIILAGGSRVHRRMQLGPAVQVNYDFHENLTNEKMDRVLEEYGRKGKQ